MPQSNGDFGAPDQDLPPTREPTWTVLALRVSEGGSSDLKDENREKLEEFLSGFNFELQ